MRKTEKAMRDGLDLPTTQEAGQAFDPALIAAHDRVRQTLSALRSSPPQVMIFEGAVSSERLALALWFAALLNCPHTEEHARAWRGRGMGGTGGQRPPSEKEHAGPCLSCPVCLQIGGGLFVDLHILNGEQGRIKIDDVREIRALLGEAPHSSGTRAVILAEAQELGIEAANALLKSLEEPCADTVFLLLAPQRERLLPTLVSRAWAITLAWPDTSMLDALPPWDENLASFIRTGSGWLDITTAKGAMDASLARHIIVLVQKALTASLAGREGGILGPALADLGAERSMVFDLLGRAQSSLDFGVNPSLVLNWLATQLHVAHVRNFSKP